jgi:glycosyltransferase involved in cell wall biosynthesis
MRKVAIAVPARDEADRIAASLQRLTSLDADGRVASVEIVVLANNCADDTARIAGEFGPGCHAIALDLPPERAHAGWARRLALDAAANRLRADTDVLMSTDADTLVASDWLVRTLDHLDAGWDAVAGLARLNATELRGLDRDHRRRLALIQRHERAQNRLRAHAEGEEPWPRHFYEGGASVAMTLGIYRRIGGAPTPPVGEDKALFDAIRGAGGQVRHPTDVRVQTSARLVGRAPGGASDTLARWGEQADDEAIWGFTSATGEPVTFAGLAAATHLARDLARSLRDASGATDPADRPRLAG